MASEPFHFLELPLKPRPLVEFADDGSMIVRMEGAREPIASGSVDDIIEWIERRKRAAIEYLDSGFHITPEEQERLGTRKILCLIAHACLELNARVLAEDGEGADSTRLMISGMMHGVRQEYV